MKVESFTVGSLFTNTYIISNDLNEAIIIDPGMGLNKYIKSIKEKYDIKAVLLTHCHIDHVDGIEYFMDLPIYIQKNEYDNLFNDDINLYNMFYRTFKFNKGDLDIRLLSNNDILNLLGFNIKVIYTPGHTSGSCCYLFDNKYLFSGDTLFNGTCGRCDFPSGNYSDMDKSLNYLVNNLDLSVIVYPGHDDITTIENELKYNMAIKR